MEIREPTVFSCCFCDKLIDDPENNSVQVVAIWESTEIKELVEQTWFGHKECFELSLHPSFRVFREEWYEPDAYL